jgi:hypothetical protein
MRTSSKIGWPVGEPLMPSLCSSLPTEKPGAVGLHDEGRDAARPAGRSVRLGEHHVEVGDAEVRDPVLRPGHDPLVAVAHGARDHAAGIRARLGLRQREGGRPLAGRAARQEALLLLLGAEELDRQRPELLDHQDQRARRARARDLLHGDVEHQRAGPGPAVLLLQGQAEDVVLGQQPAHVPGILGLRVDLRGPGRDALRDQPPHGVAELHLLLGEGVLRRRDPARHSSAP